MPTPAESTQNVDTPQGLAFAISAYVLWGFLPLYLKAVSHIPAAEVVAHRVIWSVPLAGALLILLGRTNDLKVALRSPRMLVMGCVTAALISINWGIYVWAIANDNALDAALGYYINPLFSIALGALLLREGLTRAQLVAIAFAGVGVLVLIFESGKLPWVAISLTLSWGFYAFLKKSLPIGPNQGFLLEVLILTIPALGYLAFLGSQGVSNFGGSVSDTALLMGCGVVTAVPLILYANGAKLLRLSTVGILQYIAPSMIFINAVFVFGEEVDRGRMIAFPLIWAGLVIYSLSMIRSMRRAA
ncbi:EamA family transporter RarD [Tropicibacter sp. Alg240-R139]|uniref:EamA family transporter RarD n=1 Tax=Tropicibacter sp. Alg240-R139 TaxID=2305991 RepID=UPI0013DF5A7B|nr:EamA family transporter RarD [Tropicibacter sp. Alg240-R139]